MKKTILFALLLFSLFARGQGVITFTGDDRTITTYVLSPYTFYWASSDGVGSVSQVEYESSSSSGFDKGYIYPSDNLDDIIITTNGNEPFILTSFTAYNVNIDATNITIFGYKNGSLINSLTRNVPFKTPTTISSSDLGTVDKIVISDHSHCVYYNDFSIQVPVSSITLSESTDNASNISSNNGKTMNVTLTRTLKHGQWNTFCVPFGLSTSETSTYFPNCDIVSLSSSTLSGGAVNLVFSKATSITAGEAYMIRPNGSNDISNPTFTGVVVSNTITASNTTYANFTGVTSPTTLTANNQNQLFLSSDGTSLLYANTTNSIKGFRGYFTLNGVSSTAKTFTMAIDGETTGIEAIESASTTNGSVMMYNTAGQQVNSAYKGIVIRKGEKYYNK